MPLDDLSPYSPWCSHTWLFPVVYNERILAWLCLGLILLSPSLLGGEGTHLVRLRSFSWLWREDSLMVMLRGIILDAADQNQVRWMEGMYYCSDVSLFHPFCLKNNDYIWESIFVCVWVGFTWTCIGIVCCCNTNTVWAVWEVACWLYMSYVQRGCSYKKSWLYKFCLLSLSILIK